jgi:mRNA interferase HigB
MRVISRRAVSKYWETHKEAEQPLKAWFAEAKKAHWATPNEIRAQYRSASILKNNRVAFNIAGNNYKLLVHIRYSTGIVFILFIGTHGE